MEEPHIDDNYSDHICERNYEDKFELSSDTADRRYTCGGCSKQLRTICLLHDHLLKEFLLGSYLYDHVTKTAYPKQTSVTAETQTEFLDLVKTDNDCDSLFSESNIDNKDIIENLYNIPQGGEISQISHKRKRKNARRKEIHNLDIIVEKKSKPSHKKVSNRIVEPEPAKEVESKLFGEPVPLSEDTAAEFKSYECNVKIEILNDNYDESTDDNLDIDNVPEEKNKSNEDLDDKQYVKQSINKSKNIINKSKKKNTVSKKGNKQPKGKKSKKREVLAEGLVKKHAEREKEYSKTEILEAELAVEPDGASSAEITEERNSGQLPKVEQEVFNCQHCDNQFSSEKRFNSHLRNIHRCIYPFFCKQCKRKPFRNKEEYLEHKKMHPKQIFGCDLCGKELKSREGLRLHELIHSGEKPFCCDKCDYRGRTSTQLRQHMFNHTDIKTEQCELCGKAFFTKGKLKEHLRYCRKEFNHHCQYCQKGFPTASGLRKHVLMHTGERAFVCDVCGFATFRITLLNSHMRTHTGEKPHKCKECGAQLATRGTLLLHLRTHTHEKPFVCSYCSKAFTSKWNLQTHLRQHTGETPYKCDICGQGFKQNVLRKTHMRGHLESTSVEPIVRTHLEPIPEIRIASHLDTDSTEQNIQSHIDSSETVEQAGVPDNRLEPDKSHTNNLIPNRPARVDLLHQAMRSENLHPLDLKLHYSTAEDLKNAYSSSVMKSHPRQSSTFEMIN